MAPLGSRASMSPSVTRMVAAESRLEEGRSDQPDLPAHLEAAEPVQGPRPNFFAGSPAGARPALRSRRSKKKREVTGLYESGAGPGRRERRHRGKPALSEVRPGPVV